MLGAKAGVRDGMGLIKVLVPLFKETFGLRPPRIEVVALLECLSAFLLKVGHRIIASYLLGIRSSFAVCRVHLDVKMRLILAFIRWLVEIEPSCVPSGVTLRSV